MEPKKKWTLGRIIGMVVVSLIVVFLVFAFYLSPAKSWLDYAKFLLSLALGIAVLYQIYRKNDA